MGGRVEHGGVKDVERVGEMAPARLQTACIRGDGRAEVASTTTRGESTRMARGSNHASSGLLGTSSKAVRARRATGAGQRRLLKQPRVSRRDMSMPALNPNTRSPPEVLC